MLIAGRQRPLLSSSVVTRTDSLTTKRVRDRAFRAMGEGEGEGGGKGEKEAGGVIKGGTKCTVFFGVFFGVFLGIFC